MKVLKRVFAIAISLAAIAMATSAFAATYDSATATIELDANEIAEFSSVEGQVTMAVVPENFGAQTASTDIYYINQGTAAEIADIADEIGLKGAFETAPAGFDVRVGGQNIAPVKSYDIPEYAFKSATAADTTIEGRVGVIGKIQVNAGITSLRVLLKDGETEGFYDWTGLNIASVNGAEFTFGLEIVNNTDDAAKDMSGITITGVSEIPAAN